MLATFQSLSGMWWLCFRPFLCVVAVSVVWCKSAILLPFPMPTLHFISTAIFSDYLLYGDEDESGRCLGLQSDSQLCSDSSVALRVLRMPISTF